MADRVGVRVGGYAERTRRPYHKSRAGPTGDGRGLVDGERERLHRIRRNRVGGIESEWVGATRFGSGCSTECAACTESHTSWQRAGF